MQFAATSRNVVTSTHMLSLVSCGGHVSAPMLAGRQLTSAPESISDVDEFPFTHTRDSNRTDFLACAPEIKGPLTHAAKVEVTSNRPNHGGFLATRLTCCGRFFRCVDFLLGTLRRHVSTLTTVPICLGSIRTLATSFVFLAASLRLGLRCSRGSTHTCQMTNLSTFSARFVRVRTVC